ncbi:MAG: carboxypeptidase-like regulatory domain-containing protein, partial [Luteibaculum sp.]
SGVITDESTGETLPGALVQIVGTYKGASADFDGKYVIKEINPGDYSIKVTYLGYADKLFNGISIKAGEKKTLNIKLTSRSQTLDAVEIVGQKTLIDLESGSSEIDIDQEQLSKLNTRDIKEVVGLQSGVSETADGIQIRGGRVYETQYMIDNVSAQDPLAGTGFGVKVNSGSVGNLKLITGGQGAEFGDANSGVIATTIKEGSETWEVGGSYQRDNLGFDRTWASSWNTDVGNINMSGPIPGTKKKLTIFLAGSFDITDTYFGSQANQLHSSLFAGNDSLWAPRQDNDFTNTLKLAYAIKPGTKLTLTNQHSLKVNQNSRTLQIVGFDQILAPGFQFRRKLNLDNATTYTHHSNLTALNLNHFFSDRWNLSATIGRLFSNLRADANGRPFRTESVDQILDEASIVTDPVEVFNPNDSSVRFILPGPWFINNGGIAGTWHDHYTEEYSSRFKFSYYPNNKTHRFSFGLENKATTYQWVDVFKPWVGAPIVLNDSVSAPSTRIGASSDIWKVTAYSGGLYFQDEINYNGIIATLGL